MSNRPCCSVTTSEAPSGPSTSTSSTPASSPDHRTAVTDQPSGSSCGNDQSCARSHDVVSVSADSSVTTGQAAVPIEPVRVAGSTVTA